MARCYSGCVPIRHPPLPASLPDLWLVSDESVDSLLPQALARLPRGSGFIFRHYGLAPGQRRARFRELARMARRRGHRAALSGTPREARQWRADAVYGPPERLARGPALLRLVTAHSLREVARANLGRADIVLISPVFPTRSHPGAPHLGPVRFRLLAARSHLPVIALGGMNARRARSIGAPKWAAIQALAKAPTSMFPIHS
ncbi:thiamine phosphate synthase [Novosphingobium endophyticum]|uniref:Thiamine phosphate synthase n=1 Tax=Novosphingobium endophyticum TaxID=1955250 RepID=A0A916TQK7_9SPHN|nr:thiamine phosphate synthase [Novosphingobium endophyticum]GGB88219.1 thiamine phosphate synthase [Novosphingobium endophyticum]